MFSSLSFSSLQDSFLHCIGDFLLNWIPEKKTKSGLKFKDRANNCYLKVCSAFKSFRISGLILVRFIFILSSILGSRHIKFITLVVLVTFLDGFQTLAQEEDLILIHLCMNWMLVARICTTVTILQYS